MSIARAKKIKMVLFDVDGVLTDGSIWLFPAPAGAEQTTQTAAGETRRRLRLRHCQPEYGGGKRVPRALRHRHVHGPPWRHLKTGLITKRISESDEAARPRYAD